MPHHEETCLWGFRPGLTQAGVVEGLYNLCSENKGADQLCSYCAADLRHFAFEKKQDF